MQTYAPQNTWLSTRIEKHQRTYQALGNSIAWGVLSGSKAKVAWNSTERAKFTKGGLFPSTTLLDVLMVVGSGLYAKSHIHRRKLKPPLA